MVLVTEGNIDHPHQPLPRHLPPLVLLHHVEALVAALRPDRDDHPTPRSQLVNEGWGQLSCSSTNMDTVVRCGLFEPLSSVPHHHSQLAQIALAIPPQVLLALFHQVRHMVDANNRPSLPHHHSHAGSQVTRPRAHIQRAEDQSV